MNGTPSCASALPGVRQPVLTTGMGKVVPIGDSASLAQAILEIVDNPNKFSGNPPGIAKRYAPDTVASEYETLFEELLRVKERRQLLT